MDTSPYNELAPSILAHISEFPKHQKDEKARILNDRPNKDVQVPPIALLYPPFGQFLDLIDHPPGVDDNVNLTKLEAAVNDFASLMCRFYDDESLRRSALLPALKTIFDCNKMPLPEIMPSSICVASGNGGDRSTNGHANGPAGVMETVIELKNEIGATNSDPEIEVVAYYSQMFGGQCCVGSHPRLYDGFMFPALGISIIGISVHFEVDCSFSRSSF
jgi:hypothetical protein